jgi:hypothetical protein
MKHLQITLIHYAYIITLMTDLYLCINIIGCSTFFYPEWNVYILYVESICINEVCDLYFREQKFTTISRFF